jgi:hypothetical protein
VVTHPRLIKDIWAARGDNIQYLRTLVHKAAKGRKWSGTSFVDESGIGYRLVHSSNAPE